MYKVIVGNCVDKLRELEDESVNTIVTSPPYYGLRDYGTGEWVGGDPNCPHRRTSKYSENTITGHKQEELAGNVGDAIYKTVCPLCGAVRVDEQIGLEESPEEYIERLVNVFRECYRVLKDDGTLWINIGDSYWGSGSRGFDFTGKFKPGVSDIQGTDKKYNLSNVPKTSGDINGYKNKDLIGIPWMLAFALRNDGWYLRQDIIWHKPNPMPESVRDRCTKAHEYIFLLSKSPKYYFDHEAMQEDADPKYKNRYNSVFNAGKQQEHFRPDGAVNTMGMKTYTGKKNKRDVWESSDRKSLQYKGQPIQSKDLRREEGFKDPEYETRNKRDVWSVTVKAVREAHFATFPEDLIEPCILAGSPVGGVVLDPFCGSGTTGIVSVRNDREFIGVELNPEYAEMSNRRIGKEEAQGIQTSFL